MLNKKANTQRTREKILDTAEHLFSIYGIDGTSVRNITRQAGVDLSLVNYYFNSKDKLFEEVLVRRVAKMSDARIKQLDQFNFNEDKNIAVPKILRRFIEPLIGKDENEVKELSNYRKLIALVANSKLWQDVIFKYHYDPIAEEYINAIWKLNNNLSQLKDIFKLCMKYNIDAIIATNTSVKHQLIDKDSTRVIGGVSGKALFSYSNKTLVSLSKISKGRIQLIGVGGVNDVESVIKKVELGADAIQLYSGLVFRGPNLIDHCIQGLDAYLKRINISNISNLKKNDYE